MHGIKVISGVFDFLCPCVCVRACDTNVSVGTTAHSVDVCVRAVKEKRLDLSMPKLVHAYSMAVARQSLTGRSK